MYRALRSLLFRLDAEQAHHAAMAAAAVGQRVPGVVRGLFGFEHPALAQTLFRAEGQPGVRFANPVGLAAGFDKNAVRVPFWAALGYGHVEVGSVSARPAPGNPKPRAFRLPEDAALVNRMGLNNDGADAIAARLRAAPRPAGFVVGVNVVKTHDPAILGAAALDDFAYSVRRLAPLADYLTLNISCPNTTEGKTFEEPEALEALLTVVFRERAALGLRVPVLVKLAPPHAAPLTPDDTARLHAVVAVTRAHDVAGFVATNTAPDRAGLRTPAARLDAIGRGGLSGAPLRARSTALIRALFRATDGRLPILGVGGVDTADAAYEKIRAGASLVQVYTGMIYEGPGVVGQINRGLVRLLTRDQLASIHDAVGVDA